jgi:hypothetical protein
MKFSKTLLAAALLASAGAANASIAYNTAASELFLQVYDSSRGLTFDFDLGKSNTVVLSNAAGIAASITDKSFDYDLSADSKWQTFMNGMDAGATKWGVVAGYQTNLIFSSKDEPLVSIGGIGTATTAVKNQAAQVNTGLLGTATAQDLSRLVSDSDTAKTGQWAAGNAGGNTLPTLYGFFSAANAAIAYGSDANLMYNYYDISTKAMASMNLGRISLTDSHLGAAVAAVPVPGAVWLFGTALLGFFGLNRRKAVAA